MDAIARHFGVNSLTVNRAVKNMSAGKVNDVAMKDLVQNLAGKITISQLQLDKNR